MYIPVNVNVLNDCVKIIKEYPDLSIPITSSFASSQLVSKIDIVRDIESTNNIRSICILAGWYCIGFKLLFQKSYKIISVDIDDKCRTYGKRLFNDVEFITDDIINYSPKADVVVNTSTEHIERNALEMSFRKIQPDTICYFQNNNINWYEDHVNCFKELHDFTNFLTTNFDILHAQEIEIKKPRYVGKRFSVKCIKKPMSV